MLELDINEKNLNLLYKEFYSTIFNKFMGHKEPINITWGDSIKLSRCTSRRLKDISIKVTYANIEMKDGGLATVVAVCSLVSGIDYNYYHNDSDDNADDSNGIANAFTADHG